MRKLPVKEGFFICEQKKKGGNPEKDYDSAVLKAA